MSIVILCAWSLDAEVASSDDNPMSTKKGQEAAQTGKINQEELPKTASSWALSGSAVLGAFVLYILYRHQNRQPFSLFVALNIPVGNSASYWVILLDMIVSSVIGGVSVTLLTVPVTVSQAFAAGLGMTGIFSAHLRGLDNPPGGNPPAAELPATRPRTGGPPPGVASPESGTT
jgi:hypothetical protein